MVVDVITEFETVVVTVFVVILVVMPVVVEVVVVGHIITSSGWVGTVICASKYSSCLIMTPKVIAYATMNMECPVNGADF